MTNDGEEAVPEIGVRGKKGCDGTREVNEHDDEVRIAPARPGSLTTCLGSNSEQVGDLLFRKSIASRRVARDCVTCSGTAMGHGLAVHWHRNVFTTPNNSTLKTSFGSS